MKSAQVTQETKIKERRISHDFWFYLSRVLAVLSWIIFIFALAMSFYAAPEKSYGVLRYHDIEIRQFWLTPLTGYLYLVIWFSAAGSYASMLVEKYRSRRQNDNTHYNLYFLLIFNLIWLSVILNHTLNSLAK
ncbi:hypothetical protein [Candidatus Colwellia aromaticivorans]|uniref:hypothetical protein n=1 Tax=Candidatus Colwellia aromaticivorans TaxID=2267621 RepID=UPI000DF141AC|nr:hypothetical protein [Candidatus Colwellia aromaticivorans]